MHQIVKVLKSWRAIQEKFVQDDINFDGSQYVQDYVGIAETYDEAIKQVEWVFEVIPFVDAYLCMFNSEIYQSKKMKKQKKILHQQFPSKCNTKWIKQKRIQKQVPQNQTHENSEWALKFVLENQSRFHLWAEIPLLILFENFFMEIF